jgi:GT2 family glycosyltransferase
MILKLLDHISKLSDVHLDEILIVDDGSFDGTYEKVTKNYPSVQIIQGTGQLFWTGSMALGMSHALKQEADYIFWLNHDCRPASGAADELKKALELAKVGCAGASCHIAGYPENAVNPGLLCNRAVGNVAKDQILEVDAVNGNFVAFRAEVVRDVGLPDFERFPHYGDSPYTYKIKKRGFKVLVVGSATADLEYEILRRLSPFWRVALSQKEISEWLSYYIFNIKSRYFWRAAYFESQAFRGYFGIFGYIKKMNSMIGLAISGAILRAVIPRKTIKLLLQKRMADRYPQNKLLTEINEQS